MSDDGKVSPMRDNGRSGPLTSSERRTLAAAEKVIAQHLIEFLAVGRALLTIHRDRLYRGTHESFRDYVDDRWQMHVTRAYQQMSAAETMEYLDGVEVEQRPRNELVARELGALLKTDQDSLMLDAWQRAIDLAAPRPPNARHVKQAVREVRYEHSPRGQHERVSGTTSDEPRVLPATLMRDLTTVLRSSKRNLTNARVPATADLAAIDSRWVARVRADVDACTERLTEIARQLDAASK